MPGKSPCDAEIQGCGGSPEEQTTASFVTEAVSLTLGKKRHPSVLQNFCQLFQAMGIEGQLFLSLFQHALGSGKNLAKYSVSNFGRYSSVRMGRVEDIGLPSDSM